MSHHFTQPHDDGATASHVSLVEAAVATVVLALLWQVLFRCCCSCILNVRRCFSSFFASSATKMDPSEIAALEKTLNYTFKNKSLLEEALTHTSCQETMSYERLEFLGDAALGLAVATYFFRLGRLKLTPEQLNDLRKQCVSNEKLASVAVKLGLYGFLRRTNTYALDQNVRKFEAAMKHGDDHNISAPKVLADIVESLAGAVYSDANFDLKKLWQIFKDLLLMDEIKLPKHGAEGFSEISGAQGKLYGLCGKRKWKNPVYSRVRDEVLPNVTKFVYSVEIEIEDSVLYMEGDEKSKIKDAKNSAAHLMMCSLQIQESDNL